MPLKLINERAFINPSATRSLTEVCANELFIMQNRRLVWLKVVVNEKFLTHNCNCMARRMTFLKNVITNLMGFDKKKDIILCFVELAERKFTWEIKQRKIFFLWQCRPSFRDKGTYFLLYFLGFLCSSYIYF